MVNSKAIELLKEMKENCISGTAYADPKRNDKLEALNYAISILENLEYDKMLEEKLANGIK